MFCSELLQFYKHRKTTFPFSKRSDSDEKMAAKLPTGLRADPLLQTLPGKWNHERGGMFFNRTQKQVAQDVKSGRHIGKDHFEESQFEEIARSPTGGRKLKPNAVPTLFNVPNPPSPISQHTHSTLPLKLDPAEKDLKVGDHGYARRQPRAELEEDELQRAEEDRPCSLCQHYKTQLEQQQQHTARLQREVEEMKKRLHRLSRMEKGLQMFLYEDQIRALTLTKRSRRAVWSHDTVLTARKIRCAVGVKGYEFLRELGYPLPSYRTLCNRLEPKMMMSASMQEDLAELGLGIITACESPDENGTSDEALIGIMT